MKLNTSLIFCFICSYSLVGCVGPKVPDFETKSQRFEWGKAYVWMSPVPGTERDATAGEGRLLMNMAYKKSYLNKKCEIIADNVYVEDLKNKTILLNQKPTYSDGSPRAVTIDEYKTGQLAFYNSIFKFDKNSMPYNIKIKIRLDCPNKKRKYMFSKRLKFKMVQPVLWEQ